MNKELLDKLGKKEREDFIEKEKKLEYKMLGLGSIFINYAMIYGLVVFLLATPLWYIAFEDGHPEVLLSGIVAMYSVFKILFYGVLFGFFLDYVIFLITIVRKLKLKKEYFEVVPKKR